ncbi:MAG TPA: two-component regulator propeller domain-containing protein, partial [Bryobacteraceae bacterium]|nr:two-component regulator propeller domain-containing protein [Bryobacteraceae bacterium]
SGNIWAGTESAGVMRIGTHGFTTFQEGDGIKAASLSQVLEAHDGAIVAVGDSGTRPERLYTVFDGNTFHQNPAKAIGARVPWTWQRMLLQDSRAEWWAATAHGLCRFGAIAATALANASPQACYTNESIYHIFADSQDNVWASAIGDRLLRFDKAAGEITYICQDGRESRSPCTFGFLVSAMAEDRTGNVWLGMRSGQIRCYRRGRLLHFDNIDRNVHGSVSSLFVDAAGDLWVAHYGGGLTRISSPGSDSSSLTTWDTSNGLPSNSVSSIAQDTFGDLWAGTARGVVRLNPRTGAIRGYSMTDGLPQAVFRSALRDREGAIWFATTRGLARITPEPETRAPAPPVLLTGIRIGGDEFPLSQLGEKRVAQVVLEPGRNHIEVQFAAMGAASADDLRYRVMLSGADKGWSAPQRDPSVDYRNLLAGTYRFLVKSVGPDGTDGASVAEFDFRILPPVWLRWWFELGAILLLATAAYRLHRYRVSHLLAIERMRTDIAIDLHDDIGASLARIAVLSEVVRASLRPDRESITDSAAAPLMRIGATARELLDSLNDIVWSIRAGDSSVDSLISRMRDFALDTLAQSGAAFVLRCDETIRGTQIPPDIRRHVLLIFKEAIHNVARHSGATAVETELNLSAGMLILSVRDDGKGQNANGSTPGRGGNGIPGMMRRARAMGGEIEFANAPAGGCFATLKVPVTAAGAGAFRPGWATRLRSLRRKSGGD